MYWIHVESALPEIGVEVIALLESPAGAFAAHARRQGDTWATYNVLWLPSRNRVIAWVPMPDLAKQVE